MVTVRVPHLSTASLVLYVRVGSRFETRRDNGLSHFLEHMLFRGTRRHADSYDLNLAIERLGGLLNGSTARDHSFYDTALPPEAVDDGIALLGEMMGAPRFARLDVERKAVLEEILGDFDEDGKLVDLDTLSRAAAFGDHPLGLPIAGTAANVRRFDRRALRAHHRRFYGASNLVLCAVGPVRPARVRAAARAAFGRFPAGTPAVLAAPPPATARGARAAPRVQLVDSHGSQVDVRLTFRLFGEGDPDFPAVALLWRLLDDGVSARLHRRVYDDLGLAYDVGASFEAFHDAGVFDLYGACAARNAPALVRELCGLAAGLARRPVGADELEKVKTRHRVQVRQMRDDAGALSGWYGGMELYGVPEPLARRAARVQAVSAADLLRVARRIFTRGGLSVTVVGALGARRRAALRRAVAEHAP
ncbi:MAG TPA: pitrilysin family protein [Myxococcota bacterium]|nr:pitrilysin family protein [Myxococcota bacterium]